MKRTHTGLFILLGIIIIVIVWIFLANRNPGTSTNGDTASTKTIDTKPLTSAVTVKDITTAEATIEWKTNVPTTSQIIYSTMRLADDKAPLTTTLDTNLTKEHSVIIDKLTTKTRYYYQVASVDEKGEKILSTERSFLTKMPAVSYSNRKTTSTSKTTTTKTTSNLPISISTTSVPNKTSTSATIAWTTKTPGTSQVVYGTVTGIPIPTFSPLNSVLTTTHNVTLSGLLANQKVYYQAISIDAKGNKALSKEGSFTVATVSVSTAPKVDFVSSGSGVVNVSIYWKTNVPTKSKVIYGDRSDPTGRYSGQTAFDSSLSLAHNVLINNLMNNVKFYYRIVAVDGFGVQTTSSEYSFSTPTASYIVETDLSSSGVTIKWNTSVSATSKVNFGTISGSYSFSTPISNSLVTSHKVIITGLQANTKYYYQVVSTGSGITNTKSEEHSFTTLSY